MIVLRRNFLYNLVINASKVFWFDKLRCSLYSCYKGDSVFGMKKRLDHTILIDLNQTEDELLQGCKSNTRNEIRRAIREDFFFEEQTSQQEFVDFYNIFAEDKGIDRITINHINQYGDSISIYKSGKNGVTMTMHASSIDKDAGVAMLMYSASVRLEDGIDKKDVGFSNRFLHYKELLAFKQMGLNTYDINGVTIDPNDKERYSIGLFKAGFGGASVYRVTLISYPLVFVSYLRDRLFHRNRK